MFERKFTNKFRGAARAAEEGRPRAVISNLVLQRFEREGERETERERGTHDVAIISRINPRRCTKSTACKAPRCLHWTTTETGGWSSWKRLYATEAHRAAPIASRHELCYARSRNQTNNTRDATTAPFARFRSVIVARVYENFHNCPWVFGERGE